MQRKAIFLISLLLLSACSRPPQNSADFISDIQQGATTSAQQGQIISKDFSSVISSIMINSNHCLTENSQAFITPSLYLTGKNQAFFNIQLPVASSHFWQIIPDGGIYILVAKITAISDKKTKLQIYAEKLGRPAMKTLIDWSQGSVTNCQLY